VTIRGYIRQHADAARARWLAGAGFPAAPATPGAWTASHARQPARHVPHATGGAVSMSATVITGLGPGRSRQEPELLTALQAGRWAYSPGRLADQSFPVFPLDVLLGLEHVDAAACGGRTVADVLPFKQRDTQGSAYYDALRGHMRQRGQTAAIQIRPGIAPGSVVAANGARRIAVAFQLGRACMRYPDKESDSRNRAWDLMYHNSQDHSGRDPGKYADCVRRQILRGKSLRQIDSPRAGADSAAGSRAPTGRRHGRSAAAEPAVTRPGVSPCPGRVPAAPRGMLPRGQYREVRGVPSAGQAAGACAAARKLGP
jgi:hypothetical protein